MLLPLGWLWLLLFDEILLTVFFVTVVSLQSCRDMSNLRPGQRSAQASALWPPAASACQAVCAEIYLGALALNDESSEPNKRAHARKVKAQGIVISKGPEIAFRSGDPRQR